MARARGWCGVLGDAASSGEVRGGAAPTALWCGFGHDRGWVGYEVWVCGSMLGGIRYPVEVRGILY